MANVSGIPDTALDFFGFSLSRCISFGCVVCPKSKLGCKRKNKLLFCSHEFMFKFHSSKIHICLESIQPF